MKIRVTHNGNERTVHKSKVIPYHNKPLIIEHEEENDLKTIADISKAAREILEKRNKSKQNNAKNTFKVLTAKDCKDHPKVYQAKMEEFKKWRHYDTFEEVDENEDEKYIKRQ